MNYIGSNQAIIMMTHRENVPPIGKADTNEPKRLAAPTEMNITMAQAQLQI